MYWEDHHKFVGKGKGKDKDELEPHWLHQQHIQKSYQPESTTGLASVIKDSRIQLINIVSAIEFGDGIRDCRGWLMIVTKRRFRNGGDVWCFGLVWVLEVGLLELCCLASH
jgi:hypothetical protein